MSFVATEIILENFGSFRGRQSFKLPKEPGLYFMRGENREEPRLGANGAGKSTIWKALCWVLWDKTANGLAAGDISSWGVKKGTEVILCFDGEMPDGTSSSWYFLKRTWKPNSWTLQNLFDATPVDLTKDATNPVLAMLRLRYDSFLQSIYMAQRSEMFLDLKPEPKAQLFSSVMDLDKWLGYSTKASAAASDQDRVSRRLESQQAELKGRLEESGTDDLEASADAFEGVRKDKLREIEQTYIQVYRKSKQAKQYYEDAKVAEELARETARVYVEKRNAQLDDCEKEWKALRKAEDALVGLERDLDHAQEHLRLMLRDEGCPTCNRRFDAETQAKLDKHADQEEQKIQKAVDAAKDLVAKVQKAADQTNKALKAADEKANEAVGRRDQLTEEVRSARRNYELEERHLDQLEDDSERVEKELNPFSGMLKDRQQSLAKLRSDFELVGRQLDQSYERHALYSFWIRGFKEVRLQLISEALNQLEIEVNSEVMELGLVGWELRFDVDAETKKGTLSRGFSVSVLSPQNEERVPWECWSGGESQRLRLAAQCGLSNLIRSRTGCDLPLEVWDEPTEGLSEEGITDLLTALHERAHRERRAIWVVDHRALGYGGFTETVTIIKDEKGSRVVQSRV